MSHAEQVVYDLEALVLGGEVDCSDGADLGELGGCVVYVVGFPESVTVWSCLVSWFHIERKRERQG